MSRCIRLDRLGGSAARITLDRPLARGLVSAVVARDELEAALPADRATLDL